MHNCRNVYLSLRSCLTCSCCLKCLPLAQSWIGGKGSMEGGSVGSWDYFQPDRRSGCCTLSSGVEYRFGQRAGFVEEAAATSLSILSSSTFSVAPYCSMFQSFQSVATLSGRRRNCAIVSFAC